jgi:hypothetical protein
VIFGTDLSLAYAGERRAFMADLPEEKATRQRDSMGTICMKTHL